MRITSLSRLVLGLALAASAAAPARAQQPVPADVMPTPEVGTMAPDFTISGGTRYGLLKNPIRLADFRGKTVVLAFFYRARTKG